VQEIALEPGCFQRLSLILPLDVPIYPQVAHVLLIDLPGETLANLTRVLEAHEHTVVTPAEPADAIFCGAGRVASGGVRQMAADHAAAPVIVVTGPAETGQWLDAMEHGAADYCSEPIEESEVLFTLASALCALERPV